MKELPSVNDALQTYLPLAMFITAHARKRLLKMMFDVGVDNVIHCDTDSVIFKGNVDGLNLQIGSNLGDWAEEKKPKIIYEGGFKRYVEIYDEFGWPWVGQFGWPPGLKAHAEFLRIGHAECRQKTRL